MVKPISKPVYQVDYDSYLELTTVRGKNGVIYSSRPKSSLRPEWMRSGPRFSRGMFIYKQKPVTEVGPESHRKTSND